MWSDTISEDQLGQTVDAIRSVVPAPSFGTQCQVRRCLSKASPEQVARLLQAEPGFVWLDGNDSRHFIFRKPIATLRCDGERAIIRGPGKSVDLPISSIDLLASALRAWQGSGAAMLAGYLSYDVVTELENVGPFVPLSPGFPRLHFGLYDSAFVFDAGGWSVLATGAWCGIDAVAHKLAEGDDTLMRAGAARDHPAEPDVREVVSVIEQRDAEFLRSVETIVDRIRKGDFFQANVCRVLTAPFPAQLAWPLYSQMRRTSPARYGAFLQLDEATSVLSMSPELFLRMEDGLVESHPIKGTRSRGTDDVTDQIARTDLLNSPKDAAELAMIVDVVRNDLSRVCDAGSVRVLEHRSLLELPSLYHTYSRIAGRLKQGKTIADLLRASFPPASVTGAPKIAAVQGALDEERRGRGPCMGCIGWISLGGGLELSVAIRTAFVHNRNIYYLAGCGITADSIPSDELLESQVKAAALTRNLNISVPL